METKTPKLDWQQSDFVKNCPIYYVEKNYKIILRIEYVFYKPDNYWTISVFDGIKTLIVNNDSIKDQEKIQVIAEQMLKDYVLELYSLLVKKGL